MSVFIFGAAMAWICADQKLPWKGTISKEGEITVVRNPRDPIYSSLVLILKEELALGGGRAQGDAVFSSARRIAVDDNGNIYVGDSRQACIKVFDKFGAFVRTIGRRGQGPGELASIESIAISRDDRELIVGDIGKLSVFDLQGRFKSDFRIRGLSAAACRDSRGNVVVWISDPRERRSVLRVYASDMITIVSDAAVIPDPANPNMFSPRAYWVLDSRDHLVFGYPKTYEIAFYDEKFKPMKKIRREYEPAEVTAEDRKIYLKRSNPPGTVGPPKYPCPSVHAPFRSFFADGQERLYVQTWERTPDGKKDIYDVFDPEGRFLGRFGLNAHPDPINPTPTILKNNKLYSVESDEDGFDVVKRYAVAWNLN
jgi:hypothetical protein